MASSQFIWRRVHSLMGLWLVLYLFEHLLVNSQAALWIGDDGHGFVRMVNSLESLPFLQVIEVVFIGVPLLIHGIWGVKRALSAKTNSLPFSRNRAFSWQRISSWILLFGILAHVIQMRFIEMPRKVIQNGVQLHVVTLVADEGLFPLSARLGVELQKEPGGKVEAFAKEPGKAILLMVRETFKSKWMIGLYTLFVLSACFHAFNGLWTALITWGVILSYRSQKTCLALSWTLFALVSFLGLAAVWGSYWNLRA